MGQNRYHQPALVMLYRTFRSACLLSTLFLGTAQAQQAEPSRASGGVLPSSSDLVSIPWEHPFVLPKDYVLPDSVDLSPWFPPAGDQYKQASCGGWALGYGLATYNWNRSRNERPDTTFLADPANVFSPTFIYTLTITTERITDCSKGIQLPDAVRLACDTGCATVMQFPIDTSHTDCIRPIHDSVFVGAYRNRLGYPVELDNFNDPVQWKYHLSQGNPVLIYVTISEAYFLQGFLTQGKRPFVWNEPVPTDPTWDGRDGHIMVCTGYNGDTFRVLNSWGTKWGDRGYLEVPRTVLHLFCSGAYIVQTGFQTLPLLTPGVDLKDHVLSRMGRLKGGSALGEVHRTDSIAFRIMATPDDPMKRTVQVLDATTLAPLHHAQVREDQPVTFHHEGALYSFTWTGRNSLTGKLRYEVVKDDVAQHERLRKAKEVLDLHGDGVIDGRW
jgi:hypothetical protein